jgi:hypothetical protein
VVFYFCSSLFLNLFLIFSSPVFGGGYRRGRAADAISPSP